MLPLLLMAVRLRKILNLIVNIFLYVSGLTIHRLKRNLDESSTITREIITLKMEIQQIMKGNFSSFMQKEIFEQQESVINTMRGRVNFENETIILGGIKDYIPEIKRCRRLLLIGCGTSYHSAIAVSIKLLPLSIPFVIL